MVATEIKSPRVNKASISSRDIILHNPRRIDEKYNHSVTARCIVLRILIPHDYLAIIGPFTRNCISVVISPIVHGKPRIDIENSPNYQETIIKSLRTEDDKD